MTDAAKKSGGYGGAVLVVLLGFGWLATPKLSDLQARGEFMLGRDCPFGASLAGDVPPAGMAQWCQLELDNGSVVRDGQARDWYLNGQIRTVGFFRSGAPTGAWTCWSVAGRQRKPDRCSMSSAISADRSQYVLYTVQENDSFATVARASEVSIANLMSINGFDEVDLTSLRVGDEIQIPRNP